MCAALDRRQRPAPNLESSGTDASMPGHDSHDSHGGHGVSGTRRRPLVIALVITATFLIVEFVGGLLTGSLALLADAGHMATDVAALALALGASWLASRPATPQYSFGYRRAEVLAAFVNAASLLAISFYIFWEAFPAVRRSSRSRQRPDVRRCGRRARRQRRRRPRCWPVVVATPMTSIPGVRCSTSWAMPSGRWGRSSRRS